MDFQIHVIPSLHELILQLIATFLLFLFLRHFMFKPVSKYLQERKKYIEDGVKNADEAKEKLVLMDKKYDEKILEAKKESSEIISNARKYGEEIKSKAIEESKVLAKEEYEKGIKQIENERLKAMKSMNDEIVEIALVAAQKVLRDKTDSESDKKMVQEAIKDLEKNHE